MITQILPSEPREKLIRALVAAQFDAEKGPRTGATLSRLADFVGLSAPVVLRHLDVLMRAGVVEKVPVPKSRASLYRARPFFQATWVDPNLGIVAQWESTMGLDWQFPLASRVPDHRAQQTLRKLLPSAHQKGLLAPRDRRGKPSPGGDLPALVVHGSCARGEARLDSDLDLVVFVGAATAATRKAWKDFIAEANLWGMRSIDMRLLTLEGLRESPPDFQKNLTREGITVWAPHPSAQILESLAMRALLDFVRGGDSKPPEGGV